MNLNIKDVGLVFYFLQYVNGFYDGAGSSGEHSEIWYERYEINSSHTFDNYMQFSNFEDSINDHYYKIANKKERTVLNTDNPNFKNKYELNSEKVLFVDLGRIKELEALRTDQFDVSRLIRKCKELNVSYNSECFFATALLTRAIIDHVPPIFGK
ncbi:hypothetical protein [Maribacter aurantiacus]|uniref:Uncharacterized protein n=1 Tax=Maribacter aurantiacus TaxID=1882343 RepID=A0A5R8M6M2_9FLAO|nr:hypothetical protein [Maribacter aurantiacus]TLF45197.1 hypothetical protein FEK29_07355 [Maribacter aurantiacus]